MPPPHDLALAPSTGTGIAIAGAGCATDDTASLVLHKDGISPILTAIVHARRALTSLRAYGVARIGATTHLVVLVATLDILWQQVLPIHHLLVLTRLRTVLALFAPPTHEAPNPTGSSTATQGERRM